MARFYYGRFTTALAYFMTVGSALAVPLTGNTGPGGVDVTNDTLSELRLWLKADSIDQGDNTQVASWLDETAHDNDAAQSTSSRRPVFRTGIAGLPNDRPVVRFSGVVDNFDTTGTLLEVDPFTDLNGSTGYTALAILQTTSSANQVSINTSGDGANGSGEIRFQQNGSLTYQGATSTGSYGNYSESFIGDYAIRTMMFDGSGDNNAERLKGWFNGEQRTLSFTGTVGTAAGTSAKLKIGEWVDAQDCCDWQGDIPEVIVFNRLLNTAERPIVENYLSSKYDLPLASGATDLYGGDTSGSGDFDSDVFGIGRVDGSNEVTSSGAAGFGIEATGGTLGDDEWVLAGHKVEENQVLESSLTVRWEREWYVDVSDGASVDATLAFDFSDAGLTGSPGGFSLLYRANELSSFEMLDVPSSITGDTIFFTLSGAELVDGIYTIGAQVPEPSTGLLTGLTLTTLVYRRRNRKRKGCNVGQVSQPVLCS